MAGGGASGGLKVAQSQPGPTSLEPLAMLQAYRSGRTLVNPTYQRPEQYLPQGLPNYTPPAPIVQAPIMNAWGQPGTPYWMQSGGDAAGIGTDGSPPGMSAGEAGDESGGHGADGSGGGGGGGSK